MLWIVKAVEGFEETKGGLLEPVWLDERMDLCIRRLETYQALRGGQRGLILSKAVHKLTSEQCCVTHGKEICRPRWEIGIT